MRKLEGVHVVNGARLRAHTPGRADVGYGKWELSMKVLNPYGLQLVAPLSCGLAMDNRRRTQLVRWCRLARLRWNAAGAGREERWQREQNAPWSWRSPREALRWPDRAAGIAHDGSGAGARYAADILVLQRCGSPEEGCSGILTGDCGGRCRATACIPCTCRMRRSDHPFVVIIHRTGSRRGDQDGIDVMCLMRHVALDHGFRFRLPSASLDVLVAEPFFCVPRLHG